MKHPSGRDKRVTIRLSLDKADRTEVVDSGLVICPDFKTALELAVALDPPKEERD